jgi:molybdenum cofactor cytidylyltransferase
VRNADYASGQSSSVRAGLRAVDARAAGALFLPCDQPFLDAALIDRLIQVFCADRAGRETIVVPRHRQRRGAPVLFGRAHFDELSRLAGDEGGRQLLRRAPRVLEVELDSERPLLDIDTPEDLAQLASAP